MSNHFLVALFTLVLAAAPLARAGERQKVILDTDMVEGFDDGIALALLVNAPDIDLLGVTTLSGNTWAAQGAAMAVRQLELLGRADIPVAEGLRYPLRPQRRELLELERRQFGIGPDGWVGCFGVDEVDSWRDYYRTAYGAAPAADLDPRHGADFIIDTVRAHPGEIVVAAIGPCGNLVLAVRKAPDIVGKIKRVVYMGGAFFQPGNVTPAAEFNWWFDPEAARIAVRSAFPEQIMVGLDVCEKFVLDRRRHEAVLEAMGKGEMERLARGTFAGKSFAADPEFTTFIWDVLVSAIIIDPSLIAEEKTCRVDVDDVFGPSYGHSLAYPEPGPEGSREARVILDVDAERFWAFLTDKRNWR